MIYVDLDGVVADFVHGACRHHGIINPYYDPAMLGVWRFEDRTGMTPEQFWSPLGREFWAGLELTFDGMAIMHLIESRFKKEDIHFLTSLWCKTPGCKEGKADWVRKYFPDYVGRLIFDSEKDQWADPDSLLVDDADHSVDAFRKAGGHAILVPRIWNSLHRLRHLPLIYLATQLERP